MFLPGVSQGRGNLVGFLLWGHTESDTTEVTQQQQHTQTSSLVLVTVNINGQDLPLIPVSVCLKVNSVCLKTNYLAFLGFNFLLCEQRLSTP